LNWVTESEYENQGFIINRALRPHFDELSVTAQGSNSEFIEEWSEIASFTTNPELLGQGSTSAQHDYSYIDKQVKIGETYGYRLSDVDYRGQLTQHAEIIVSVIKSDENHGFSIKTYPNPSNSGIHLVVGSENNNQPLRVDILNLRGGLEKNLFSGTPLTTEMELAWDGMNFNDLPVPSGVYIVNINSLNISHSQMITIIQ
ncbi:MAG: T9SS type A sorting domain-containing protein, partial [Candidatus Marinimicrobia bacterium]|nr:T9SS type A sorting domain-containing protein [Candidatus Neomarinimicrobiota bacterium]